ncbi:MAG: hypothetical protein RIB47_10505 [Cyclobacteriaceae bacterium]
MIKRIHYFSGLILIAFISVHILNHATILISEDTHLAFMQYYRKVYRLPLLEGVLFCAILIQVVSGGTMLLKKWRTGKSRWARIQLISGGYFVYFLIVHPAAVLYGRYVLNLDTNLYFGAAVLNISPIQYFFVFHYGLAILAFFTHLSCVHQQKMQRHVTLRMATVQATVIIIIGAILSVVIVGRMVGIAIPPEYLIGFS